MGTYRDKDSRMETMKTTNVQKTCVVVAMTLIFSLWLYVIGTIIYSVGELVLRI